MTATVRPTREAFIAYWKDYDAFSWRQVLPYLVYPGALVLYAFIVRSIDTEGRFWLLSLIVAIGYVFLVPYLSIRHIHKRYGRFIRCPSCGDWFGQDVSGSYSGPNPKFRGVIETGRCGTCGEQILSDDDHAA